MNTAQPLFRVWGNPLDESHSLSSLGTWMTPWLFGNAHALSLPSYLLHSPSLPRKETIAKGPPRPQGVHSPPPWVLCNRTTAARVPSPLRGHDAERASWRGKCIHSDRIQERGIDKASESEPTLGGYPHRSFYRLRVGRNPSGLVTALRHAGRMKTGGWDCDWKYG